MNALHVGQFERTKAGAHGVILGGCATAAIYNVCAWLARADAKGHLLFNAALYTALTILETKRVRQHWRAHWGTSSRP